MRIIIETNEADERVALRPEDQGSMRRGTSTGAEAATDAGPPREDLLQALGEQAAAPSPGGAAPQEPSTMVMPGSEPPPSRH